MARSLSRDRVTSTRLFGRRVAEEEEADDRDQQDPEQRQQHRAAPVQERAQGDRDERCGHRRTR